MTTVFSSDSFFIFFHPFCEWFSYPTLHSLFFFFCPYSRLSVCRPLFLPLAQYCTTTQSSLPSRSIFLGLWAVSNAVSLSFQLFSRLLILNIYICLLLFLPLWSTRTRLTFCHFCTLTSLPTLRSFRLISSLLALSFITRSLTLESPLLSSSASVSITLTFSSFSLCFLNPKPTNSV